MLKLLLHPTINWGRSLFGKLYLHCSKGCWRRIFESTISRGFDGLLKVNPTLRGSGAQVGVWTIHISAPTLWGPIWENDIQP
ncbi:hypothetical protein M758_5G008400 [Ceratodon purpureus]|uniref:Uncharacterized protein n=1 Tax=Ceratodon purpureus TaxID=3225 RepID=A0A8T0HWJ8_CERPU|nr:hypothetical protein KC19_5G007600 [Ceratodon purpureus]KAG0615015.1 hypothetical protein M758_5G008400 [Ceratodon purpureus]